eukprot:9743010-Ditylum_brightwellii.AAC.1
MKCTPSSVARRKPSPSQVARGKLPPSPVARGKPSPSSVARNKPRSKPGLNKRCGTSPNELLEEEMQITCKRTHYEWKREILEGKVQSECPLSPSFGCTMSNVNKIY